jgi:HD superfamily phosphohydrolase YqeK
MREIEAYLRSEVSLGRYLHSLRVAKTTVML